MILEKGLYSKKNHVINFFRILKNTLSLGARIILKRTKAQEGSHLELGAPALTVVEDGGLRCTSCMLCQEVCPSFCIKIEKTDAEEEAPLEFDINILKCTFCGLCEEVCPVDAIRMVGPMPKAGHGEQNWIWDKNYLSTYAGELISDVGEQRPLLPN